REDADVIKMVTDSFEADGLNIITSASIKKFEKEEITQKVIYEKDGKEHSLEFDKVFIGAGRKANTKGLGLEKLGIKLNPNGTVNVDPYMRTNLKNIYACGDVAGPYQFTHMAAHQAWYCAVNALFAPMKKFAVDYSVVPWATYTDPEVARVGLNEKDAIQQNIPYEVTTYPIDDLDRAIADRVDYGMVKVLTVPNKDKILGVTIVGFHAGDIMAEYVLAMTHGLGLNKILGTIHPYPTLVEANKYAAGEWKKAHKPEKVLGWLESFHGWGR
ncbi:MAG: pyruvate/2-oxoglutarate dehydrogenase complex dihydrolipoamide dehydrogenase (E3) component, partial [bacterium]